MAGYESDRFSGSGRTDNIVAVGAGAKYLANEYMQFGLKYDYSNRDSPLPVFRYADNAVMLDLGLQL